MLKMCQVAGKFATVSATLASWKLEVAIDVDVRFAHSVGKILKEIFQVLSICIFFKCTKNGAFVNASATEA